MSPLEANLYFAGQSLCNYSCARFGREQEKKKLCISASLLHPFPEIFLNPTVETFYAIVIELFQEATLL